MARIPLFAANWKMHSPPQGWDAEDSPYRSEDGYEVIVFPTLLDIRTCLEKFLVVGAQFGRPEDDGAFTGDVSMRLIAEHGCKYVLCGHSERRKYHGEDDAFVASQMKVAQKVGLTPILCVGETEEERDKGATQAVVERQLLSCPTPTIVAYEPRWAIGSDRTATPEQAQEVHAFIRSLLPEKQRDIIRILYGGSVKPDNAKALMEQPDIDGLLVGGASLDPKAFGTIVKSI